MDEETIIPAEGADTEDAMKAALWKRAVGYDVEEVTEAYSEKFGAQTIRKTKHIPGDIKAMEQYRRLYGEGI